MPEPKDIYRVRARFGGSDDARPCLILEALPDGHYAALLMSGQFDLFRPHEHFQLDPLHPDFEKTGLPRRCYIDGTVHEIAQDDLIKKYGVLTGELEIEFDDWFGL